jgi:hypothetical protein
LSKASAADYSRQATERCERVLVTVLGNIGPWAERVYLAGGLAPRYLISELPAGVQPHVGSTDVDLIISVAVTTDDAGAYRTLHNNLRQGGFTQGPADFQWRRKLDEGTVLVEFLCETEAVAAGRIFKPKQDYGSKMAALNVAGAELARRDHVEAALEAERLDDAGRGIVRLTGQAVRAHMLAGRDGDMLRRPELIMTTGERYVRGGACIARSSRR